MVCTLAHGLKENDVIQHEYFGTQKVIDDLMLKEGWNDGLITL